MKPHDPSGADRTCVSKFVTSFLVLLFCAHALFGQDRVVSGVVKDETGNGTPGVNVLIKNMALGTATDAEGRYSISIASTGDVALVFSFVGYTTQEIAVGPRSVIDVQLTPDIRELQEIVVTGYSSINKKDIASSISVVDVTDMTKIAASNFAEQLQGKVAGVQIATSGDPGAVQYVRIRGIGTINNNEPLYVIDGVPVQNETDMNFLNPNDIESMQVLKDASASIYGARAANGVIVITTKRGRGKTKLNVAFFSGIQDPQNFPKMPTPDEMLEIEKGSYAGAGIPFDSQFYIEKGPGSGNWTLPDFLVYNRGYEAGDPAVHPSKYVLNTSDPSLYSQNYPISAANKEGTDWFREMYKPASMTSLQLSASGGNEKGTHYFSMNYYDHNGILINNRWKRFQTRLNSTFFAGKNIRVGENLNIAFQTGKGFDGPRFNVENVYRYPSIIPVNDINGYWAASGPSSGLLPNPVAQQTRSANGLDYHTLRLTGNAFAEFDFLKYLTFKTNVGLDYYQNPTTYYSYTCPECGNSGQSNSLDKGWFNTRSWVLTGTLNYNRSFGNHTLYALAGGEGRDAFRENFHTVGRALAFGDDPYYRELGNAQSGTYAAGSNRSDSRMISAFVNVNYTFNEKYILAATLRGDGSSRFVNHKFGFFPGVSAAWRISQEPFLTNVKFISGLKLRASYGASGNNEVVGGDYPGFSSYGPNPYISYYPIDGALNTATQGFAQVSSGNPNLKWETSVLTNFAFDATLMRDIDLTLEWYNRETHNMIYAVDPPLETGNVFPVNQNIGSTANNGIDLQMTYRGKDLSKRLSYSIGLTGTHYTNKVLSLDAKSNSFVNGQSLHPGEPAINRTQSGYPVSQFYGYAAEGLWESYEEINQVLFTDSMGTKSGAKPGRRKFMDTNGDGEITSDDRTFIGNPLPKFILGLNLTLNWKNFDLATYFSGVFGKQVFNTYKGLIDDKKRLYEAGTTLPVLDLTDTYSGQISSYYVEDGSFLRFRNIILGYSLSGKTLSKTGLTKARIYFQAQNLFTWTKYSGLDPDVTIPNMYQGNVPQRDLMTGLDLGRYPSSRQFIIGVNIEF